MNNLPYKWIIGIKGHTVVIELDNQVNIYPPNKKAQTYFKNNINLMYNFEIVVKIRDEYDK